MDPPVASQVEVPRHRIRLILKDGSYQTVLSYLVQGDRVRYRSAERNGEAEDIPLALVDLPATKAWERAHDPDLPPVDAQEKPPVLSPELAREESARQARTPEVANLKDATLRLPEEDSMLALDTFQGLPELVPLPQEDSDLNKETAHTVVPKEIDPAASPHDLLTLKGERADVQLHVAEPALFVRLEGKVSEGEDVGGGSFTVDTQANPGRATPSGGSPQSSYVLERVEVRRGEREVSSFLLRLIGTGRRQPDVVETQVTPLPGGIWEKLVPVQPLEFGEYVLIELLDGRKINAGVWDFGVHPTAKENDEAIRPEPKRPAQLERRPR